MEQITMRAGEAIFRQGDPSDCMYDILSGTVGVFLDYGGAHERKLTELGEKQFLGEMGLLDKAPRSATAVALSDDTRLQVIREEDFTRSFEEDPERMLALLQQMSTRLRRISRDYAEASRTIGDLVEARKQGAGTDAALSNRIAKTLAGYEVAHLDAQEEE